MLYELARRQLGMHICQLFVPAAHLRVSRLFRLFTAFLLTLAMKGHVFFAH